MVVNPCVLETPLEAAECLNKAMGTHLDIRLTAV